MQGIDCGKAASPPGQRPTSPPTVAARRRRRCRHAAAGLQSRDHTRSGGEAPCSDAPRAAARAAAASVSGCAWGRSGGATASGVSPAPSTCQPVPLNGGSHPAALSSCARAGRGGLAPCVRSPRLPYRASGPIARGGESAEPSCGAARVGGEAAVTPYKQPIPNWHPG
eukprot:144914-Chlamydomonas_euryale.AAC.2